MYSYVDLQQAVGLVEGCVSQQNNTSYNNAANLNYNITFVEYTVIYWINADGRKKPEKNEKEHCTCPHTHMALLFLREARGYFNLKFPNKITSTEIVFSQVPKSQRRKYKKRNK